MFISVEEVNSISEKTLLSKKLSTITFLIAKSVAMIMVIIAIAFIAWFKAPAPMACISTLPFSLKTLASAPATLLGFDFDETLSVSIIIDSSLSV